MRNYEVYEEEYEDYGEKDKLVERDAYTFQGLSENARKMFYPEAYNIRTSDLEQAG